LQINANPLDANGPVEVHICENDICENETYRKEGEEMGGPEVRKQSFSAKSARIQHDIIYKTPPTRFCAKFSCLMCSKNA
jgi:hypothetical protein